MGYQELDRNEIIASGNAVADLLSRTFIKLNGECNVQSVGYADATDEIVFDRKGNEPVIIPRVNFAVADWDEDEDGQSFYMVQDGQDITHLFVFYKARNESLEIMRQLKELL